MNDIDITMRIEWIEGDPPSLPVPPVAFHFYLTPHAQIYCLYAKSGTYVEWNMRTNIIYHWKHLL
jgi:hypothetical protein